MRRQLLPAVRTLLVFTVLVGLVYPLAVTAIAQVALPRQSEGSLLARSGATVGSQLLGQNFAGPQYLHPRPSAAGDGYDPASTAASNLGPTNPDLLASVQERVATYRQDNLLDEGTAVPVDAVTASGSGLDPHVSVANARLQAARIAEQRGVTPDQVLALIEEYRQGRVLGVFGEPGVNVLSLNLALDELSG